MATFHMIPTQKAWDAVENGRLNNMTISACGVLIPKMSEKSLDKLVDDLNRDPLLKAMNGMINWTNEQLEEENIKLAKMLEDQEND